jgi:hypothetical protein
LNGRFEIRVTNELEEVLFLDRLELIAVDHPSGLDVFPNEGMADPPKPFRLHTVADPRVPSAVVDDHGHDVTGAVVRLDRRYPDDFAISPIRGYAEPHTLTIDLGPSAYIGAAVLLLTGWTDYAFSSDNVAAHQAGLELRPPSLEIRTPGGSWRPAIHDIGVPVGRPQTLAIDLGGRLRPGEHIVRLATNMRIYWDQILVARAADPAALRTIAIDPGAAVLTDRGFSAEVRRDGREPVSYDYHRVASMSPWKVMAGRYTREGDVRDLLMRSDDRFVVAKPGDQVALSFDAGVAGSVKDGWTRTFLLRADGFSKEMDINSASPDAVEPLPFHRMTRYPDDARTRGPGFRRYIDTYQSRVVTRPIGPLIRFHGVESR